MSHQAPAEQKPADPRPSLVLYKNLVSHTADEEPVIGWAGAGELPCLTTQDVKVVLANRGQAVIEEITFDDAELLAAISRPDFLIVLGTKMGIALERAAREALWPDVSEECTRRDEERWGDERESAEGRHGVATLFRGSHR